MDDTVELTNFRECLTYVSLRNKENIAAEFSSLISQASGHENISDFFQTWNDVKKLVKEILPKLDFFRRNEASFSNKMAKVVLKFQLFLKSNDFDSLENCLNTIKNLLSPLAKWVQSVFSFTVADNFISQRNIAYDQYMKIGEHLSTNVDILNIKNELRTLKLPGSITSRFAAIVCPSLVGKTQLAFTLSQSLKVIYVNLSIEGNDAQKVYRAFSGISNLFRKVLEADADIHTYSFLKQHANTLQYFRGKLFTLGLLAHLMNFPWLQNGGKWFDHFVPIRQVDIEKLTVDEFTGKFNREQLLNFVLFLDEFPDNFSYVLFLRNLARVVGIPCVLAATNSNVANLVGISEKFASRKEPIQPWVKLITKLPPADPFFLAEFCLFECNGENRPLSSFIVNGNVDVTSLFLFLRIIDHVPVKIYSLFKLILNQGKTCLPGILFFIFQNLDKIFKDSASDMNLSDLSFDQLVWNNICKTIYFEIRGRKQIDSIKAIFAGCYVMSSHISSFDNDLTTEYRIEFIDKHFYHLGTPYTAAIQSMVVFNNALYFENEDVVRTNGDNWRCHSYFSKFNEDIFLHIASWGQISALPFGNTQIQSYGICYDKKTTLAQNLEQMNIPEVFKNKFALKNNFKGQETLICWAVGNASHFDISGKTKGLDFILEFSGHIQSFKTLTKIANSCFPREFLCMSDISAKLISFLNCFTVPYCVQTPLPEMNISDPNFNVLLSNFMEIGYFFRCADKDGFDLSFKINFKGELCDASAECKYTDDPTDMQTIMNYSLKSIKKKTKLTLFISSNLRQELKVPYSSSLLKNQCQCLGITYNRNDRSANRLITDTDADFKLNHYSICISPDGLDVNQLRINNLFEHNENPDGIFLIIETNFLLPKV